MELFEALNEQMNFELESAYIYRTMQAYLSAEGMDGMAHFMKKQVEEEVEHAEKMAAFLEQAGETLKFRALNPGQQEFQDIRDVFAQALEHEKVVTSHILDLMEQAKAEKNEAVEILLQWYVTEQMEEHETFTKLVNRLDRIHGNWGGLYILDGQLAHR